MGMEKKYDSHESYCLNKHHQEYVNKRNVTLAFAGTKYVGGEDTGVPCIVIGVDSKLSKGDLSPEDILPSSIDGVPTDVISCPKIYATSTCVSGSLDSCPPHGNKYRPLVGGISIGPFVGGSCTLGLIVRDLVDQRLVALTNNHCVGLLYDKAHSIPTYGSSSVVGGKILQPSFGDAGSQDNPFGLVKKVKALKFGGDDNSVDAATISIAVNESWFEVLEVNEVRPYPFAVKNDYSLGQEIVKSGRTTGVIPLPVTTVVDKNAVVVVDYSLGEGGSNNAATFTNQILYSAISRMTNSGDSGAAVLGYIDGRYRVLGLNFAGNAGGTLGVACPIEDISSELGVAEWDGNVVVPQTLEDEIFIFNTKYVRVGNTTDPITHYIGYSSSSSSSSSSSLGSLSSSSSSSQAPSEHLVVRVSTPGLNQWTTVKPIAEAEAFAIVGNFSSYETQYGFYSGPDLTWVHLEAHKVVGGTISAIDMDYRRYKYGGADSLTYNLIVSQAAPGVGADLLGWDVFGAYTPNGSNHTTDYNMDISACLAFIDSTQDFWISAVSKPHYDGDDPSTWPDSNSNGGSVWMNIYGLNVS